TIRCNWFLQHIANPCITIDLFWLPRISGYDALAIVHALALALVRALNVEVAFRAIAATLQV
ncbi:MAG: hypothetical protein ACKPKO_45055, partial [Candidatus Fonsibacter sp.]